MAQNGPDFLDPSKRANAHLNTLINDTADTSAEGDLVIVDERLREQDEMRRQSMAQAAAEEMTTEQAVVNDDAIPAEVARTEAPIVAQVSDREGSRLLFITTDNSIIHPGSLTHKRFADLRQMFLEIHVIVLDFKTAHEEDPIIRLFENVWVYTTKSSSWWMLGYDAFHLAEKQLVFSGGFRVDFIVAEDPFIAGAVGLFLARKYERPFQVHVYEDFFDPAFVETLEHPTLYDWITKYVLKHVSSVRVKTEFQRTEVLKLQGGKNATVELLPSYYDLEAWKNLVPSVNLKERYPQFKFIILHISSMRAISHSSEVLMGAAPILRRYPTIGLVMLGNGPLRPQLEREAISLGLQNQIEFEPMPQEVISHMKSANLLIHISEDGAEDDIVLAAAAVRLPMVANASGLAGKLFVDGESASLCVSTDSVCVTENINRLLNENQTRSHFSINAHDTVFERIEQNYDSYLNTYRESIEHSALELG